MNQKMYIKPKIKDDPDPDLEESFDFDLDHSTLLDTEWDEIPPILNIRDLGL